MLGVRDVDVARAVHGNALRLTEIDRPDGAIAELSSGDRRNVSVRHFSDPVVTGVGDVQVSDPVHRYGVRFAKLSGQCWPVAEARHAGPRDGINLAVLADLAHDVVAPVGNVGVARSVDGHPVREAERGLGGVAESFDLLDCDGPLGAG